jgi:hypothetical protein
VSQEALPTKAGSERPQAKPAAASPPKLRALGITLIAAAAALGLCLLFGPMSWVGVPAVASSVAGAWVLGEIRTLAWFARVPELQGEPWGIDAWVVIVSGLGVAALSALGSSLAWPLGWILAGLLGLLGVRVIVR